MLERRAGGQGGEAGEAAEAEVSKTRRSVEHYGGKECGANKLRIKKEAVIT